MKTNIHRPFMLLLFLTFATTLFAQPRDLPPSREPGKCYAKCLVPIKQEAVYESYTEYTGNFDDGAVLDTVSIIIQEEGQKWEKKPDPNCKSKNPKDCLIWCLVPTPEIIETLIIVDPKTSENYKEKRIEISQAQGSEMEWVEVLCPERAGGKKMKKILIALAERGYRIDEHSSKWDAFNKEALTQFQKDNNLPLGNLNFATLDLLGVKH